MLTLLFFLGRDSHVPLNVPVNMYQLECKAAQFSLIYYYKELRIILGSHHYEKTMKWGHKKNYPIRK